MNKFLLIAALAGVISVSSCKKDNSIDENKTGSIENLVAPANFDWATARDVNFNVAVTDSRFGESIQVISIYAGDPLNGGVLLSKGSATLISSYKTKVYLPSVLNEVYVVKTAPDGTKVSQKVSINGTSVSLSVGAQGISTVMFAASGKNLSLASGATVSAETSPDCTLEAGFKEIKTSQTIDMSSGDVYAVTGSNITVELRNINGGTIRVCGKNVTLNNGKISNGATLVVTTTGEVTCNNVNWDPTGTVKNFGKLTVSNLYKINGTFYNAGTFTASQGITADTGTGTNYGTMEVSGQFKNAGVNFTNNGVINVSGEFVNDSNNGNGFVNNGTLTLSQKAQFSKLFTNSGSGSITVSSGEVIFNGSQTLTSSGTFMALNSKVTVAGTVVNEGTMKVKEMVFNTGTIINQCRLIVTDKLDISSSNKLVNYSFVDAQNNTTINGNVELGALALFQTKYLEYMNGTVKGIGTDYGLFRVVTSSGVQVNDNGGRFQDKVKYCDNSRTLKAEHFQSGAMQSCDIYIPKSTPCNDGFGTPPPTGDTDGDGVINSEDEYPEDPARAYKKHFSVNYDGTSNTGGATVLFEDNWPLKGDYDMNDVVVSYRYEVSLNAKNKVVQIDADYTLHASGATLNNGFGVEFPFNVSTLDNVQGAALEGDDNDKAVIIVFDNAHTKINAWNTVENQTSATADFHVVLKFKDLQDDFGAGPYNPFIFNNVANGKRNEVHLPGYTPTKLANTVLAQGVNSATRYYVTTEAEGSLPWAIQVPLSPFNYPVERASIDKAYPGILGWAENGGAVNGNWYTTQNKAYCFFK